MPAQNVISSKADNSLNHLSGFNRSDVAGYSNVEPPDTITHSNSSLWIPEDVFNMKDSSNMQVHPNLLLKMNKNQSHSVNNNKNAREYVHMNDQT